MDSYPMYSQPVTLRLESSPQTPDIPATLHWHSEDPLAMAVIFGRHGERIWEFALSLLEDALAHPATVMGLGDVRVWAGASDGLLWISVSSPSGSAVLSCPVDAGCSFLSGVRSKNFHCTEVVDRQIDWILEELRGEIQP
jgi:Streptomyces sporulation and cell division protein, SsgA